jgi:hypothetical protein
MILSVPDEGYSNLYDAQNRQIGNPNNRLRVIKPKGLNRIA